ncbi:MAG: hypothetical protein ACR2HJ_12205 [Fimbriimonadales bacterium]
MTGETVWKAFKDLESRIHYYIERLKFDPKKVAADLRELAAK